jgi:uroporphyrinogen-III synthase
VRSPVILLTRAAAAGERTATRLRACGYTPLLSPVTRIVAHEPEPPADGAFDAILLTSAHAAAFLPRRHAASPLFAVGRQSAAAARAAGFPDVRTGAGDASALAALIGASLPAGSRLLHVAGRDRKAEPAAALRAAGFEIVAWSAYAADPVAALSEEALAALVAGRVDAALHFSHRSAELALRLACGSAAEGAFRDLLHLCLSGDVAEPLGRAGLRRIAIADRPSEASLLDVLVGRLPPLHPAGSPAPHLGC